MSSDGRVLDFVCFYYQHHNLCQIEPTECVGECRVMQAKRRHREKKRVFVHIVDGTRPSRRVSPYKRKG